MGWYKNLTLKEVQTEFGSPLWIICEEQIHQNIKEIRLFTEKHENILYPVKANPSPAVMEIIASYGIGADCANLHEVNLAIFCGFSYQNIVYNSPYQDLKTCLLVLKQGGTIVLDDLNTIKKLEYELADVPYSGNIWLRINPTEQQTYAVATDNQELMAHNNHSSKFGIPEENLKYLFSTTNLQFSGLHLHVGTQMDNLMCFQKGLNCLYRIAELAKKYGHTIQNVDIGGGLGIAFSDNDSFPSISEWANVLNAQKQSEYQHFAELGHAFVGNAVCLLTQIQTIKESRGRTWAVCDVGTDQLAKVTLLRWPHKILTHLGHYLPMTGNDALAGPMCFAGDVLLPNTDFTGLSIGDPLLITNAGAYTYSLANNFNGRTSPSWVLYSDEKCRLITEKEKPFNRILLQHHYWKKGKELKETKMELESVKKLQSEYLSSTASEDQYEFVKVSKVREKTYKFTTKLQSPVDFMSMPLAVRVFGDAAIVSVLNEMGVTRKQRSVWGEKLDLEYFSNVSTTTNIEFTVSLSEQLNINQNKGKVVVSFNTQCDKICGTFIIAY